MEPLIHDGDAIVVHCDIEHVNGDTVVIRVNLDGEVSNRVIQDYSNAFAKKS